VSLFSIFGTLLDLRMLPRESVSIALLPLAEVRKPYSVSNPFSLQQWRQGAVVQRKDKKYILIMNT